MILQTGYTKIATINLKNKDHDNFFHYAATAALNYEEIKWNPELVSNVELFTNKYNWKGTNYPSKTDDGKTFEKNNPTIALNTLYIKEKEIYPAYISKPNSAREKKFLNDSKWKKRRMALSCGKKLHC